MNCYENTGFWTVPNPYCCFCCLVTIWTIVLFKILPLHPSTFSLHAFSHPFCTTASVIMPWCEVWDCTRSVLKALQPFPFMFFSLWTSSYSSAREFDFSIELTATIGGLCACYSTVSSKSFKLNKITGDVLCTMNNFWGLLSHLKIGDRWMITVADVICDVNTISSPLNGIIYHRESVMTGKWCMSKKLLWCQANFSWSVPGKGFRVNERVTSVLSLASFTNTGFLSSFKQRR